MTKHSLSRINSSLNQPTIIGNTKMYAFSNACEIFAFGDTCSVLGKCVVTGKLVKVDNIKREDLRRWAGGELIQRCFPYLSADDREFLKSGMSAEAWTMTFGTEND